ncbi:hypothetical protein SAMN05216251_11834 [Actinacidiphila alni]|uniref:DUF4297 domain-containing protein n=2 Tax=Actinacidiphila alni TaxID=380248 RepID=A0A1I2JMX0_9ACTN|nr:hypothetical protein SAMN05216251_11834 [Actinacidiphila alni]
MAAADGLELYRQALGADKRLQDGESRRILCEYHEDWVALHGDAAELVSAKHRDPSTDAYRTLNELTHEGGLAHLFLRWRALQEKPTCRLATSGGLANGDVQKFATTMRALREVRLSGQQVVVTDEHRPSIDKFHSAIHANSGKYLPKDWIAGSEGEVSPDEQLRQIARFMSMLNIQAELTRRADIGFAAPTKCAKPVVDHLGFDVPCEAVWNVVYGLFFTRMKAAGPRVDAIISPVLAFANGTELPTSIERERELASRIVTMQDIDLAVMTAVANPSAYGSLASPIRLSRAAVKMRKGNCSDNSIERGEQLRRDYQRYWRNRLNGDPTALAEREKLRRLLLRVSDRSDTPKMRTKSQWGADFWITLQDALEAIPIEQVPSGMDADLLLGGISDLTNECKIWFSEIFDVAVEIERVREENRGSVA